MISGAASADLSFGAPQDAQPRSSLPAPLASVRALVFDTFGTVVDWRTSITQEVAQLAARKRLQVDAARFADAWRAGYAPAMARVRSGQLPWTKLDALHRMILERLLKEFSIVGLTEAETDQLNVRGTGCGRGQMQSAA
jgi:2-haloacid dehalogenase